MARAGRGVGMGATAGPCDLLAAVANGRTAHVGSPRLPGVHVRWRPGTIDIPPRVSYWYSCRRQASFRRRATSGTRWPRPVQPGPHARLPADPVQVLHRHRQRALPPGPAGGPDMSTPRLRRHGRGRRPWPPPAGPHASRHASRRPGWIPHGPPGLAAPPHEPTGHPTGTRSRLRGLSAAHSPAGESGRVGYGAPWAHDQPATRPVPGRPEERPRLRAVRRLCDAQRRTGRAPAHPYARPRADPGPVDPYSSDPPVNTACARPAASST